MTDPLVRLLELHAPVAEEAEFFADATVDHDERWPDREGVDDDALCAGHVEPIEVCRECGYSFDDDGQPAYRSWPCPTRVALLEVSEKLHEVTAAVRQLGDEL